MQAGAESDHLVVEGFSLEGPQADSLCLPFGGATKSDQFFDDIAVFGDQCCVFDDNNVGAVEVIGVVVTDVNAGAAGFEGTAGILENATSHVGVGVNVGRLQCGAVEVAVVCGDLDDIVRPEQDASEYGGHVE